MRSAVLALLGVLVSLANGQSSTQMSTDALLNDPSFSSSTEGIASTEEDAPFTYVARSTGQCVLFFACAGGSFLLLMGLAAITGAADCFRRRNMEIPKSHL